jgi:ABC-2 type transport system ATP-binding protein
MNMIELDRVSKRYGSKTIIHDISFNVKKGEIVGFLGPNGAGKTTTMRMISGFTSTTSGTVKVAGFDMATQNHLASQKLGYLPEHPPLYDVLGVKSYLRFVATAKGISKSQFPAHLEKVVDACKLASVVDKEIYKLSKGYRQRVGLAQALLGDPEVLLLDEPTASLDPGQIHETREVIRLFGSERAVLLSTHILSEVTLLCSRVAIINQGRMLAVDTPDRLQQAAEESNIVWVEAVGDEDSIMQALQAVAGVVSVSSSTVPNAKLLSFDCMVTDDEGIQQRIARAVTSAGELQRLERRKPTLENIFLRYVAQSSKNSEQAK